MLQKFIILSCIVLILVGFTVIPFPDGAAAMGIVFAAAGALTIILRQFTTEKEFVTKIFLTGLVLRLGFGMMIEIYDLRDFFGPDAYAYDLGGYGIMRYWSGLATAIDPEIAKAISTSGIGWGMNYFVGVIYMITGRNLFAAQSVCAVIGAATAPMVFFCSQKIFNNLKVAKFAAVAIAVFPSFIIWSGQLLKDGPIICLLALTMTMVLQLQEKFSYKALAMLAVALAGVMSLRFYIFYMVLVAVAGSFLIGLSNTNRSILRNTVIMAVLGLGMTYLGVGRDVATDYRVFGLQRIQSSRLDLTQSANSGFGDDTDVSTTEGALSAMPTGFKYLYFAPFPWEAANLRQSITIPEVLVWWATMPFLVIGLFYTIKHRLRSAFPILIFSLLLTLAYSITQGNVGTAYRQRTQIQVFLFIIIGVGWTVYHEQRENKRLMRTITQRKIDQQLRAGGRLIPDQK